MVVKIVQGDALAILKTLKSDCINTCITSPPYWGLRDYETATWIDGDPNCNHRKGQVNHSIGSSSLVGTTTTQNHSQEPSLDRNGNCSRCGAKRIDQQLGLESSPDLYVQSMVDIFRQVRRCLRPDGTLWLNLGDSYAGGGRGGGGLFADERPGWADVPMEFGKKRGILGLKNKDLVGIPWRVAFALQADGWYLRQDIIWAKPNPMPESVRDRCTKSHEYLFMLSKNPKYFYDANAVAEPVSDATRTRMMQNVAAQKGSDRVPGKTNGPMKAVLREQDGHGRRAAGFNARYFNGEEYPEMRNRRSVWTITTKPFKEAHFATFPPDLVEPCALAGCPENGVILDPFAGSGTVGLVANKLNRHAILFELNPEYVAMAMRRCGLADDTTLAKIASRRSCGARTCRSAL